jgi:hypothetical protein
VLTTEILQSIICHCKSASPVCVIYYIIKTQVKCHVASSRSLSKAKNSHINKRKLKKKEKSRPSILQKGFRQLRFNPLKLIWIQVESFLMIPHMLPGPGAQLLRWPTRLNVTLNRVPIGYVFVEFVTESETCHVYKTILLTI